MINTLWALNTVYRIRLLFLEIDHDTWGRPRGAHDDPTVSAATSPTNDCSPLRPLGKPRGASDLPALSAWRLAYANAALTVSLAIALKYQAGIGSTGVGGAYTFTEIIIESINVRFGVARIEMIHEYKTLQQAFNLAFVGFDLCVFEPTDPRRVALLTSPRLLRVLNKICRTCIGHSSLSGPDYGRDDPLTQEFPSGFGDTLAAALNEFLTL